MILSSSAELLRILRSELNWQRLVFIPSIALLILFLIQTSAEEARRDEWHRQWFMLFAAGWGSFSLIWSIKEEFSNRTWYWQQMLPLTPRQLLGGRLAGVLLLPWVGGLLILTPILLSADALLSVLIAALVNAAALFLALVTLRDGKAQMAIPCIVTVIFYVFSSTIVTVPKEQVLWYGWELAARSVAYVSLLFYLGWALIGCLRLFAQAKHYPPQPLWWPLFLGSHLAYAGGFYGEIADLPVSAPAFSLYCFTLWLLLWSGLYFCAFLNGRGGFLLFIDSIRRGGHWRQHIPPWLVTAICLLPVIAAYGISADEEMHTIWLTSTALSFFALRDLAILFIFALRPDGKLPEGITIVVLLVLYLLLPFVFTQLTLSAHWFVPPLGDIPDTPNGFYLSLASSAVQCLLAFYGLWRLRLRHHWH